jgi:tripartite ATP-independent transporter DctP family solute receptor
MIDRRMLLAGLAAGAWAAPARSQTAQRLRVSTAAPIGDFLEKAMDSFKAEVEGAQAGVTVDVYPGSTLFKQGTEVPALQRGNLEMSTMTTFEVAQQIPSYGFLNRGYLFRDYNHLRRVFDGPIGEDYRRAVSAQMEIEILATAYLGTRQVALRKARHVASPADLAGVKMRMPAGPEWLLLGQALGVNPVPLGASEVYLALKTGTIDGQENPVAIFNANKFYEVSEQMVLTSHLVQPVFINIASAAWKKLSDAQKKVVAAAAQHAAAANDSGRLADETSLLAALKGRGMQVVSIDLAPFRAHADQVYGAAGITKSWDAALMQRVVAAA